MDHQLTANFKRINYFMIGFFTLLGFILAACGLFKGELGVGDPAPSFTLPSEAGEQVSLADYLGKKPVLLYFHMADG
jgi:hypothetical protein